MPTSHLFSPIKLGSLELWNRIVVAPMCQYSATDGNMTDWHVQHLGSLANSGAGLVIAEATGVELEGRISHGCPALANDANEASHRHVVEVCKKWGTAAIGIQLAHAGRKASTQRPWEGGGSLKDGAWETKSASAVPYDPAWHTPHAMTIDEIEKLKAAFVQATRRADRAGYDLIEIHAAHGYLLNQFLSPISNQRTDKYGGNLENRMRLPLEIFSAVRGAFPATKPVGIRISAVEWVEGGITVEDSIALATKLKALGCDFMDVSSGGNSPKQKIELKAGYQVPFAAAIRKATGMTVMAVGLITEPKHAEAIVASGEADMVALARGFMDDLRWGWHAAWALGVEPKMSPQHRRIGPKSWPPARKYAEQAAE
ncbi:MAG: NADH:flavin oxidoreductase/NADH oxidase [Proteobacteria bacterium]|nr:NADH:flavin oxidoreductase/NADH oxidase [Pseudomonadota bacterium]